MKPSIIQATDRFVNLAFQKNPNIKDFGDFKDALFSVFGSQRGQNAKGQFDEETIIHFFESSETRDRLKFSLSEEEYEELYGDGHLVQRQAVSPTKMVIVKVPKVQVKKSYKRGTRTIQPYVRGKPIKWTSVQERFIQTRKLKKISPKQIVNEYNRHFKNPRTSSSIKTKIYRSG